MYILAMMSNVIYFNIFTIKHEMGQASLVCAVARSGGGAGGQGLGEGAVVGGQGCGDREDRGQPQSREENWVVWKGEKER